MGLSGTCHDRLGCDDDRVKSLNAGLDLEMPDCHGETDQADRQSSAGGHRFHEDIRQNRRTDSDGCGSLLF